MYRVKFLQVSTGQILGLLPLYQLDYRNHHHQLINVHESVRNIFLPIIIFIAIIFRHIWASSTLYPSSSVHRHHRHNHNRHVHASELVFVISMSITASSS